MYFHMFREMIKVFIAFVIGLSQFKNIGFFLMLHFSAALCLE